MGIETFVDDNIDSITVILGGATALGLFVAFLFPPTGIFLLMAAAGISCGVALTVVAGTSWVSKQNAKEPDDKEDEFKNIKDMTHDLQITRRDVEELKAVQESENKKTELLSQDVKNLEDKTDKKSKLTDNSIAFLKQGQMELTGRQNSVEADVKDLQSMSQKVAYNSNTLFATPQIPSDSSQQPHGMQNQFH